MTDPAVRDPWHNAALRNAEVHFLEDAAASLPIDRAAPAPPDGPMGGLLIGVKANIAVKGQAWTAGLAGRSGLLAPADASVVAALRARGARILSRLFMDEGALGASGTNPHFGRCENPAFPGHSAGGSSGGPAAAVAAGVADAALGSDTMGSVRIPAAYCGVYGLKLDRQALPMAGVFPLAPSLDSLGVFARTPERLTRVLEAMEPAHQAPTRFAGWLTPDPALVAGCAPEVAAFVQTMQARLAVLLGPPDSAPDLPLERSRKDAFLLTEAEAVASLGTAPGLSPALAGLVAYGRGLPPEKLEAARTRLARAAHDLRAAIGRDRVVLLPTLAAPAFAQGTPPPAGQADFTAIVNAADLPALAIPAPGAVPPVSVQLVGPAGSAAALVDLAAAL